MTPSTTNGAPPKPMPAALLARAGARARDAAKTAPRRAVVPPRLVERMRRWAAGDIPGGPVDAERVAMLVAVLETLR